ncbi:hypothetical protein QAD02_012346 [Eretmocerus hayati]|uniref:Uncharacterized protein n=1 Tax=Eretmocerus hayati TaxID=131215 RepID=A0ACC2NZL8_9HYME|nr:hypothetical protein QAD02_012346 [Eretmocerus hayati]
MAELCTSSFIYYLVLLCFFNLDEAEANYYKRNYIEYTLGSEAICKPINGETKVDDLKERSDSAVLVEPGHVFDSWRVLSDKHCKFRVKGPKLDRVQSGLFAVIQRMSLRRRGSECLDYIRFTTETGASEKYCGKLVNYNGLKKYTSAIELSNENSVENFTGMFEDFSRNGKISTEIFISKDPLEDGETLDLCIVYTPYKVCKNSEGDADWWSSPPHDNICINKEFACDGYTNCVSRVCSDESNCTNSVDRMMDDGFGKITISAVTSMFLSFIIFLLCLWICRKHEKLCWSSDCAGPSTTSGNISGLPMDRGNQGASDRPYVPTAPMLEVAVPSSHHDKDLPPSYDSLFPVPPNATNP